MDSPILILLAGGKSKRMGSPKGLLDYHGSPWILEQIGRYKHLKKPMIYIGLGYDYKLYLDAIPWFNKALENSYSFDGVEVKVIINHQPQLGPFSTLQTILNIIDTKSTIIVQPIDVPLLNKEDLAILIKEDNIIVIPTCNAKNGHPVKLKPEFWDTLLTKNASNNKSRLDTQIKLCDTSSVSYVKVKDISIYQNINTINKWFNFIENKSIF